MWEGVAAALSKVGMNISAELLRHSTNKKPQTLNYDGNSNVAKKIKEDTTFKNKISEIAKNNPNNDIKIKEVIKFSGTDLQGSFNNCTLSVNGKLDNGSGVLKIQIFDTYDFKYEKGYFTGVKGFIFTTGNNMAWSDQCFGVINKYDIYVKFSYEI